MLKRLSLAFAGLFAFASVALAAGTIPISLTQRFDNTTHLPLAGGQLFSIQAGTTSTPQNAYQDSALTIPYPNPLTLDAGGDIPQLFFADGSIKIRITNALGVQQIVQDNILVIGPSSGGGGGGTVDPTTILTTGDIKVTYGTGVVTGFVRANGRTIGSATSGATERANSDTQALFLYLWGADANLTVSTGRGVSAAADWAANKTLTLPDWRGRTISGLDDMGNSAAGRLTSTYFGSTATVLGASGGAESETLTIAQMPAHNHGITDPGHTHAATAGNVWAGTAAGTAQAGASQALPTGTNNLAGVSTTSATTGITINNAGGGAAHPIVPPMMLATIYVKL